ncbi:MAG: SOS response-associated peptidase [Erysipelotrichaceae bacterium]
MCGRINIQITMEEILERFSVVDNLANAWALKDYYPSEAIPMILEKDHRTLAMAKWGFGSANQKSLLINARYETLEQKPTFASLFQHQRCLIPVSSFYEWDHHQTPPPKVEVSMEPQHPFALAGLYRKTASNTYEVVIVTMAANEQMATLHERCPLILNDQEATQWVQGTLSGTALKAHWNPTIPPLHFHQDHKQTSLFG